MISPYYELINHFLLIYCLYGMLALLTYRNATYQMTGETTLKRNRGTHYSRQVFLTYLHICNQLNPKSKNELYVHEYILTEFK